TKNAYLIQNSKSQKMILCKTSVDFFRHCPSTCKFKNWHKSWVNVPFNRIVPAGAKKHKKTLAFELTLQIF
ncbi:hypothetical protein, partial [Staphylococcus aureus]|uniref:hypothetical protein n=1 Tax=Staphylococcus aureus TaxID=1280 RepID=UPI001CD108E5